MGNTDLLLLLIEVPRRSAERAGHHCCFGFGPFLQALLKSISDCRGASQETRTHRMDIVTATATAPRHGFIFVEGGEADWTVALNVLALAVLGIVFDRLRWKRRCGIEKFLQLRRKECLLVFEMLRRLQNMMEHVDDVLTLPLFHTFLEEASTAGTGTRR